MIIPPRPNDTVQRIYNHYASNQDDGLRPHLGASMIGKPCARELWFDFRWALKKKHDGQLLLLFERGQLEEARFISHLKAIGVECYDIDDRTGKQFLVALWGGHFGGSMDGVGKNIPLGGSKWHVLEFKTHSDKSFKELQAKGVKHAKYQHYCQMMIYMGMTGLIRSLYLAVNKNNDALYCERIYYDEKVFKALIDKAENIVFSLFPPGKISDNAGSDECKYCNYNNICHFPEQFKMDKNCRTCVYSDPTIAGAWRCSNLNNLNVGLDKMSVELQKKGCEKYDSYDPKHIR